LILKDRSLKNFVESLKHYTFPGCVLLSTRIPPFEIENARTVTHIVCILKESSNLYEILRNIEQTYFNVFYNINLICKLIKKIFF